MSRILTVLFMCAVMLPGCTPPSGQSGTAGTSGPVTITGKADIGGPFELVDHSGRTVTQADYLGRPQLIYFGFSYCPDVCPLALQQMGAAQAIADPDGNFFQPIFISVDPERDTPESLARYVTANGFPKNLIGLTGTEAQVKAAKKVFRIYAEKVPDPDMTDGYTVDHVSLIYLMDEKGEFVDVFTHNSTVPEIAERLKSYRRQHDK